MFSFHVFDVFAELDQKIVKEFSIQIFAHLIENEPVADGTVRDVAADQIKVFASLEISEINKYSLNFKVGQNLSFYILILYKFQKYCRSV